MCKCIPTAVHSNMQSFFQTWNQYKCNCYAEGPATGTVTTTFIATVLVGILLLLFILTTIGWIWTCKIAIKRGKLLKKKGKIVWLSYTQARSMYSCILLYYVQKMPFLCLQIRPTVSTRYQPKIRYLKQRTMLPHHS